MHTHIHLGGRRPSCRPCPCRRRRPSPCRPCLGHANNNNKNNSSRRRRNSIGGTQTGSYQTGSYQKGRFIPPTPKRLHV